MKKQGDSGKIGGFAQPSDGWHAFQITKDVGWQLDDNKKRTDTVVIPLEVIDDDKEKGRRCWQYCELINDKGKANDRGQLDLANFILWSGVADQLEKDCGIAEVATDLLPPEWGAKFLSCKKKSVELINTALSRLPQKAILGEVISYDGKNKDGDKVKRKRINEIKEYKKGGASQAAAESDDSGSAPATANAADWDE